jgi:hypothetical protein
MNQAAKPKICRIAVVQSRDGEITTCPPDADWEMSGSDQIEAATVWHMESGFAVDHKFWVEFELPTVPEISTVLGEVK